MDLSLLSLARQAGQDRPGLPGLYLAPPQRRPARGRQADRLAIIFHVEGGAPLNPEQQDELLPRLSQTYFKTSGSVTAALRTVAETLNDLLLERNLRMPSGRQGFGMLTLLVLRGDQVYLAMCGPMHAFIVQAGGARHIYDSASAGRGLGVGRAVSIQYAQAVLSAGDTLIVANQLPPNWSEVTLAGVRGQGPEGLRRRLLSQAGPDLNAFLLQARNGPGEINLLQAQALAGTASNNEGIEAGSPDLAPQPLPQPAPAAVAPPSPPPADRQAEPASVLSTAAYQPRPAQAVPPAPAGSSEPVVRPRPAPAPAYSPPPIAGVPEAAQERPRPGRVAVSRVGRSLSTASGTLTRAGATLVRRMLPGEGSLPSGVMAFFAVAVPLVVVTIATVVYFQRGRAGQYQTYYAQAVQAAQEAQAQTEPDARRTAWGNVITNLNRAETYGSTAESQALRAQAQGVFDELEGVRRVDFQPAIAGGIPAASQITRLIATESDLYLLDAGSGSVLRAALAGQVYELDDGFQCGPGLPTGPAAGPLVDIAAIPKGNDLNATVMGLDAQGNLVQCIPGAPPVITALAPPATGWRQLQAFVYDLGNMYVLDPQTNGVWVYWGDEYTTQPQFFFSEQVPPMEDVIDLAVDKSDLYLLHADGRITLCTFSNLGVAPTRCTDPFPYSDSRPGREGLILIPEKPFTEIRATQPPDPSLYLLDADSQAMYHFSLRLLTFQRQLRSLNPLPAGSPATAFAIRPDGRMAFMALGNRVYYGGLP
jgi:hypothetical protein